MKSKLLTISSSALAFLLNAPLVFGATGKQDEIIIKKPSSGGIDPNTDTGVVISNAVSLVFVIGIIAVLFMLITGGYSWITSGGDKEAVGKARQRIIQSLIGLLILAVSFLLAKIAGQIVGIDLLKLKIPSLDFQP